MGLTIELPPDWEANLQRAARRHGKDVQQVVGDGVEQRFRQNVLPESESRLLKIINAHLAPESWRKRDALLALQAQRPLAAPESNALMEATDSVETANALRWQVIAELANRRGRSVAEIAGEFEIPLP